MNEQIAIDFAASARDVGMQRALDHAESVVENWGDLAYAFLRKYAAEGLGGLADASSRPASCPHQMSPEVEALTKQYQIVGVPTTVFVGADGRERPELRQSGLVLADDFLKLMDQALAPATASAGATTDSTNATPSQIPPQLLKQF